MQPPVWSSLSSGCPFFGVYVRLPSLVSAQMGRLLDPPTAPDSAELAQRATLDANVPWPEPPCRAPAAAAAASAVCSASVAVLVVGEFRSYVPPVKPRDNRWKDLTPSAVWRQIHKTIIKPNGPADVFVHSWDSELAMQLVSELPAPPCASVCEAYGGPFFERVLARYRGCLLYTSPSPRDS